jgi:two-component system, OmpR family, response regulator
MMYHERCSAFHQSIDAHFSDTDEHSLGDLFIVNDDDWTFRERALRFFRERNCKAQPVRASDLLRLLKRQTPALILLDLEPAKASGLELLRGLRSRSDVPVIVTGMRESADRILALEFGADLCMPRTSVLQELWASARALRRRATLARADQSLLRERGVYQFAGWTLNRLTRVLTDAEGKPVAISRTAHVLLAAFLDAPGRPLTRFQLLQATRGREDVSDRSVDVQVLRLRRILERDRRSAPLIETERGIGYRFVAPVQRRHALPSPT